MMCNICIHKKACINACASMGYFIDETRENEHKHTILKCKEFEDKGKYEAAIEKQIPKKPITIRYPFSLCCPICHSPVGFYSEFLTESEITKLKYCAGCGQRVDWSE